VPSLASRHFSKNTYRNVATAHVAVTIILAF
jgi:hypothetical protein